MVEKDLKHLSADEVNTLMSRYYDGESASHLIAEYNISAHASELYKLFPPEVFPDYICEYCGEPLVIDRPSKTRKMRQDMNENCIALFVDTGHFNQIVDVKTVLRRSNYFKLSS